MEKLPSRYETYYRDPHGRTVSWRRPSFPTKESSNVSFSGALDTLELKDKEFVEWMKKNYIEDLEYIGMMPCAKSSRFRKIYPISELYNAKVDGTTDTYGGRYEYQKTAKGGYKPRSKKSHKKGFKNIHAKKTRKFHK